MNDSPIGLVADEERALVRCGQQGRIERTAWLCPGRWLFAAVLLALAATLVLLVLGPLAHELPSWLVSGLLASSFVLVLRVIEPTTLRRLDRLRVRRTLVPGIEEAVTAAQTGDDETEAMPEGGIASPATLVARERDPSAWR